MMISATTPLHFPPRQLLQEHLAQQLDTDKLPIRDRLIVLAVAEFFGDREITSDLVYPHVFRLTLKHTPLTDVIRRPEQIPDSMQRAYYQNKLHSLNIKLPPNTPSRAAEVAAFNQKLTIALMSCVNQQAPVITQPSP